MAAAGLGHPRGGRKRKRGRDWASTVAIEPRASVLSLPHPDLLWHCCCFVISCRSDRLREGLWPAQNLPCFTVSLLRQVWYVLQECLLTEKKSVLGQWGGLLARPRTCQKVHKVRPWHHPDRSPRCLCKKRLRGRYLAIEDVFIEGWFCPQRASRSLKVPLRYGWGSSGLVVRLIIIVLIVKIYVKLLWIFEIKAEKKTGKKPFIIKKTIIETEKNRKLQKGIFSSETLSINASSAALPYITYLGG